MVGSKRLSRRCLPRLRLHMSQTCVSQIVPGPAVTEMLKLLMTILKTLEKICEPLMSGRVLRALGKAHQDPREPFRTVLLRSVRDLCHLEGITWPFVCSGATSATRLASSLSPVASFWKQGKIF